MSKDLINYSNSWKNPAWGGIGGSSGVQGGATSNGAGNSSGVSNSSGVTNASGTYDAYTPTFNGGTIEINVCGKGATDPDGYGTDWSTLTYATKKDSTGVETAHGSYNRATGDGYTFGGGKGLKQYKL